MYLTSLTYLECSNRTLSPRLLLTAAICKIAENHGIAVAAYSCIFSQSLMLSSALRPVISLQPWARLEVDYRVDVLAYATQP